MSDFLCKLGIHAHCSDDGGMFGDAITCHLCGYSKYPEVFSGIYLIKDTIANYRREEVE